MGFLDENDERNGGEEQPQEPSPASNPAGVADTPGADLPFWKEAIRRDFEAWLETVDAIPDSEKETPDSPDLYTFFEQLAILSAETRKGNRRTAEAFSQWSDILEHFQDELRLLRDQFARKSSVEPDETLLSRRHCLALVELLDRLQRMASAFEVQPKTAWWNRSDARWRRAWQTQRDAFDILLNHFRSFLEREGVSRIDCMNREFDPTVMAALAVERDPGRPDNTVVEELAPGYHFRGVLLRAAQVRVNVLKKEPEKS